VRSPRVARNSPMDPYSKHYRIRQSGSENIRVADNHKSVRMTQSANDEIRMPKAFGVIQDGNDRGRYAEQQASRLQVQVSSMKNSKRVQQV